MRRYSLEFTREDYNDFWGACEGNNIPQALNYINLGIDINKQDGYGDTALMLASYVGNAKIVEALINAGADFDISNAHGDTAIEQATIRGNEDIVEMLVKVGANLDIDDSNGNTILIKSIKHSNTKIAKLLIGAGANVNIKNMRGESALGIASFRGYIEVVKLLIEAGANLNTQDEHGVTPLIYTAWMGNKEVAKLLIDHRADIGICDDNDENFIQYLIKKKNYDMIYYIFSFSRTNQYISQSEYNQLIRSKRIEDKLRLIYASNVSKQTLLYLSSDKYVGILAKERYKELRSKLGGRFL